MHWLAHNKTYARNWQLSSWFLNWKNFPTISSNWIVCISMAYDYILRKRKYYLYRYCCFRTSRLFQRLPKTDVSQKSKLAFSLAFCAFFPFSVAWCTFHDYLLSAFIFKFIRKQTYAKHGREKKIVSNFQWEQRELFAGNVMWTSWCINCLRFIRIPYRFLNGRITKERFEKVNLEIELEVHSRDGNIWKS